MAKQPRTIRTSAKISGVSSARMLGILDRLARIGQQSIRMARATVQVRTPGDHRLQIPAHISFPTHRRLPEASQSARFANWMNRRSRMTAMFDGGGKEIQGLAPAMNGLSRVEPSIESGSAAWADSNLNHRATRSSDFAERAHRAIQAAKKASMESPRRSYSQVSNRSREGLEAEPAAFARDGLIASARTASSIRGVIPIRDLSQREFAEPAGNARVRDGRSQGITMHSSPTVVINSSTASSSLARDAIGALSAHREELFNQLKRESARRERAQF